MIDETYKPQPGELTARETFVTDYYGRRHLSHIRVTVHVRVSHDEAQKIAQRYSGAMPQYIYDEHGEGAEIEIPLRLTDADIEPYLRWRDALLERVLHNA